MENGGGQLWHVVEGDDVGGLVTVRASGVETGADDIGAALLVWVEFEVV